MCEIFTFRLNNNNLFIKGINIYINETPVFNVEIKSVQKFYIFVLNIFLNKYFLFTTTGIKQ